MIGKQGIRKRYRVQCLALEIRNASVDWNAIAFIRYRSLGTLKGINKKRRCNLREELQRVGAETESHCGSGG